MKTLILSFFTFASLIGMVCGVILLFVHENILYGFDTFMISMGLLGICAMFGQYMLKDVGNVYHR